MSNSFVEILIAAALNESKSVANINKQIEQLQTKIKDINVNLKVNADMKDSKIFAQIDKEIESLQKKAKELDKDLEGIGDKPKKKKPKILGGISDQVIGTMKSLEELETYLKKQGFGVRVDFSVNKSGQQKVQHVLADIKNEMGQIETLKIKPVINQATGVSSFKLYAESLKDTNFKDFEVNQQKAIQLMEQFSRQGKLTGKDIEEYTKRINSVGNNTDLQRTVDQMKELSKITTSDSKHLTATKNLNDQAKKSLDTLAQLRVEASRVGLDTKQFDSLISKMTTLSKIDITNDAQIAKGDKLYSRLSSRVSDAKNNLESLITAQDKFNNLVTKAGNKGVFNPSEIEKYESALRRIIHSNDSLADKLIRVKTLTSQVGQTFNEISHKNKMADSVIKAQQEVERLNAMLTRTENSYRRTVDRTAVSDVRNELQRMANVPSFANEADVKKYNQELQTMQNRIKQINSDATTGARANLDIISSIKVALERFPIWMLSSTIFYSTVRGIKDLTENVIELDTAMIGLQRVANAEQWEFDKVIERSIENVTNLSGKLKDYLELVNEYARTGKTLEESYDLADTTQMLVNISDLNAKESMDSITSAMIAFNIEASESARIADRINEIDNKFPVTSKILSDGMLKASATASTFGVSIDELLGHITSVSSLTRESGSIVG